MSSCISSHMLSASSTTMQQKLRLIWKQIRSSNLLLAGLIDAENISTASLTCLQSRIIQTEEILKLLGRSINLSLFEKESTHYYHLSAGDANMWVNVPSKNDPQVFVANNDNKEIGEEQAIINDDDELTALIKNISCPQKLPYIVFSTIEQAFQYFSSKPRYSKEACVLDPCLPVFKSSLGIGRGDIVCVKRHKYEGKLVSLGAYYHFGVYVGKITTNESSNTPTTLENAVIDLTQNEKGKIIIRASPLVSDKEGEGFLYHKKDSNKPPLFFKAVYKDRTHEQKEMTARRAEEIYRYPDNNVEKYSLLSNNCEHFANACAFGTPYCEQHARFMLTTIPGSCKALSTFIKIARWPLITATESSESIPKWIGIHISYIGEAAALGMLLIECAMRISWDIYLLKKSGGSTSSKIKSILKKRLLSMAPELLAALGFLLVGILCTVTGPIGAIIGIGGFIVLLLLRFIARPRIERWIEEREEARREDFLRWYPSEVARLVMKTADDDDPDEHIMAEFERQNLSGHVVTNMIQEEREGNSAVSFENTFQFLGSEKFKIFMNNLNNIFGHLTMEKIKYAVTVTYQGQSFMLKRSFLTPITAHQVLEMARLNWKIDYAKGDWQLISVGPEDGNRNLVASSVIDNIEKTLDLDADSSITLELSYTEPKRCTLL
ncbi:unnamed protein product [Rotaria magnacalcarata]|uniref:LRAT domain-containing protein n=2 Tax=Rotaria magnacalcarata TaxID=392030 RepID=A0A816F8X8_9BILA|nr:unnamed protein product [Rotaria magnacalcarata]